VTRLEPDDLPGSTAGELKVEALEKDRAAGTVSEQESDERGSVTTMVADLLDTSVDTVDLHSSEASAVGQEPRKK
jgi:hypothetical protein